MLSTWKDFVKPWGHPHHALLGCGRVTMLSSSSISICCASCVWVQEEVFQRREEALKKKDLELQENLIKFSKFLQVLAAV
jgi:hypothetical protein